ncbi:hypothetical protein FQR65_LT11025 [Abscondita terminalis]|nr:hypothetical protein FQR65_LT11025 [Abscondita terminalis]
METKLYKRRWLILFLYDLCCGISLMQWIQFSIVGDVIAKYYEVSYEAVNWTSMICLLLYIPAIFPGNLIMEKFGLHYGIIGGMFMSSLGAWIKFASVPPNMFWMVMVGQSLIAVSQVFFLGTSAEVAAEWFGCDEVSFACSIGASGCQAGIAIGFVLFPILVKSGENLIATQSELTYSAAYVALINSILLLLVIIFFKEPDLPPSQARLLKYTDNFKPPFFESVKKLIRNRSFAILAVVYGLDTGIMYTIAILLNEIILNRYENGQEDAGRIGLLLTVVGTLASILFGIFLDKFKLYKFTIVVIQFGYAVSMLLFTVCLSTNIMLVYVTTAFMGIFMIGMLPVGFEVAAEITYPESENISSSLLNVLAQVFGILLIYLYKFFFYNVGTVYANALLTSLLLLGVFMLLSISYKLKRQEANNKKINDSNGLHDGMIGGVLISCLGSWLKFASVPSNKFLMVIVGQSFVAVSQVFFLSTSAEVAAEWFGCNEVSFACSIAMLLIRLELPSVFVLFPILVKSKETLIATQSELTRTAAYLAVLNSIVFMFMVVFFKKPDLPPSQAQLLKYTHNSKTPFIESFKKLIRNRSFAVLAVVYGLDVGILYTIAILLNEIILNKYENGQEDAGRIGLLFTVVGTLASILFGIFLDKFKLFKFTIVMIQFLYAASMLLFTVCFSTNIMLVYVTTAFMGIFMIGIIPIGFEVAAEITYPESENISSSLLIVLAQVFGIVLIYLYKFFFYNIGVVYANALLTCVLSVDFCSSNMEATTGTVETNNNDSKDIKVYRRRWLMLFLYFISVILSCMQWAQYSTIANVVIQYYNVSFEAVNWTTMLFLLIYIPLIFPVTYILEVLGLRNSILAALLLTCISCWLKVVAVSPTKFWLVLVSQSIGAVGMPLVLSALSLLTAEWFNLNQISTASSIGVLAYQLGSGIGFILSTFTIPDTFDVDTFGHNFYIMLLSIAIFTTVYLVIFLLFFEDKPPLPPSEAKLKNTNANQTVKEFFKIVVKLLKNPSFIIVLVVSGIANGISTTIDTLLNQIMTPYYENASVQAGRIAFVTYGTAALGPIVAGLVLDKFNKYKFFFASSYIVFLLLLLAFTFTFNKGILIVYITLSVLGFFGAAIDLISLETALEITYPVPESICSGMIFGVFQACSIIFVSSYSEIFYMFEEFFANIFLCLFSLLACILTFLIKFKYLRQNAQSAVV